MCIFACLINSSFYLSVLNSKVFSSMDHIAQENLKKSVSMMEVLFQELYRNSVEIRQLEIVISERHTFIYVAKIFEDHADDRIPLTSQAVENLLLCREKDLKALEEVTCTVQKLARMFEEMNKSMYL